MTTLSQEYILVGAESLTLQCGKLLVERGHRLLAVVTSDNSLRMWAESLGIPIFDGPAALLERDDLGCDYLFSIGNRLVLPSGVLRRARRAAINFHDGPLPRHAGLFAPVWALIARELSHGITWHVMTDAIDAGNVLKQRLFEVSEGETALTLNTKCYEVGLDTFEELVLELERGEAVGTSQAPDPSQFHRQSDRPPAACSIDWRRSADDIAALVRALDFGDKYPNPVGRAKTVAGGTVWVVPVAEVLNERSGNAPGTIVRQDGAGVVVATGSSDVLLPRLMQPDGTPANPEEPGLKGGESFEIVDEALGARLTTLNRAVARHETFWVGRLATAEPFDFGALASSVPEGPPAFAHVDVPVQDLTDRASAITGHLDECLLAGVQAYFARWSDRPAFACAYTDAHISDTVAGVERWFSAYVPMRADLIMDEGLRSACERIQTELRQLRTKGTFATDVFSRYPQLKGSPATVALGFVLVPDVSMAAPAPGCALTVVIGDRLRWIYDTTRLSVEIVSRMIEQFRVLFVAGLDDPDDPVATLPLLPEQEWRTSIEVWNATQRAYDTTCCVHQLFEAQAARTPDALAVVASDGALTYRTLDARANQLAHRLQALGVGPDCLVGLSTDRSSSMLVGLLGILKAGGAYVPLDPGYPRERLDFMVRDAGLTALVTRHERTLSLLEAAAPVVTIDSVFDEPVTAPFRRDVASHHLAYVIYTSGSTGTPKGVMVEHRNVVNFFAAMDDSIGTRQGVWLAVTSLSFDISVLELLWTLSRGFKVVMYEGQHGVRRQRLLHRSTPIDFSLFYFSSDESATDAQNKYRLLLDGARFADENGFAAVWTPERHFHAFGGLYPNPAVTSAAIATITKRVQLRAGSCVLPLHHPLRVAEEWSVVDNLSGGRAAISFASGWQPNDFVLRPENHAHAKQIMLRDIETVRELWRGRKIAFPNSKGEMIEVGIVPRPVQKELPVWLTTAGNPETFAAAGRIGARVLTHLLGQSVDSLSSNLAIYRAAWREAGHPGNGFVSLMLHTFIGTDDDQVKRTVRQPLIEYLRSSVSLIKQYASAFPAFKKRDGEADLGLSNLSGEEMDALLEYSFERYYETSGLFGTPQGVLAFVDTLKAIGVDDIACLIDFGVDTETVLAHLHFLAQLRELATPNASVDAGDGTIAELIENHRVTHLQCTPSMATMLLQDEATRDALGSLQTLLVGGEACSDDLARELLGAVRGTIMNMYGPTETCVWSTSATIGRHGPVSPAKAGHYEHVSIGKPVANTCVYVLDRNRQPRPIGLPGELYIGGDGTTRGYWNRAELSADRFVPDPYRGGRMYRTGDLVRWRDEGVLEFLGRIDHQVKIRGHRIELGEIERAIAESPAVREVVVVAREDVPGDKRLAAYIVPRAEAVDVDAMRSHLQARLPDVMVPTYFVTLSSFPLTPNGKLDRKSLPPPTTLITAAPPAQAELPAGEIEELIAGIWRDVLQLQEVGTQDNFFDLGGHSLLAVQAHRRLKKAFDRSISMTDLFRFPTIRSLAQFLSGGGSEQQARAAAADRAEMRRRSVTMRARRAHAGRAAGDPDSVEQDA